MTSAAEQLAQNFSWSTFSKARDLQQRLLFTLGALIVFRFGIFIPLPGIDVEVYRAAYGGDDDSAFQALLQQINLFAGGALENLSIFSLSIFPYISASIIMQLMRTVIPEFERLQKEGESGRRKMNQYTRYLTVMIALFQALGIAVLLENFPGVDLVMNGGFIFRITTMVTLTGGTVFLMWLGEQITARGVGNGISLLIFAGIVASMPSALWNLLRSLREDASALQALGVMGILIVSLAMVGLIVYVERAQRKVPIQYPSRTAGNKQFQGQTSFIPMKINAAGVIPAIFASTIVTLPLLGATFGDSLADSANPITAAVGAGMNWFAANFRAGEWPYLLLLVAFVVFFTFFYTAIVFNPEDTARNLKEYGGFIPGVRPGKQTVAYLDIILSRLTLIGASYLAFVVAVPELARVIVQSNSTGLIVPIFLGGTSLLIMVTVSIDFVSQVQTQLMAAQYETLLKRNQQAGRTKRRDTKSSRRSRRIKQDK